MSDEPRFDPDERFKLDLGDEEPEEALRRLLDKKKQDDSEDESEDSA